MTYYCPGCNHPFRTRWNWLLFWRKPVRQVPFTGKCVDCCAAELAPAFQKLADVLDKAFADLQAGFLAASRAMQNGIAIEEFDKRCKADSDNTRGA